MPKCSEQIEGSSSSSKSPLIAAGVMADGFFFLFALLLSLPALCSSGALAGFSYDAKERGSASWSPTDAPSFRHRNLPSPYQFKLLVADPENLLDSLLTGSDVPIDLCVSQQKAGELLASRLQAFSWLKNRLMGNLPGSSIRSILVNSTGKDFSSLLPTLKSVQTYLRTLNLDRSVKVSPMFSLSTIENLDGNEYKSIRRVLHLVRNLQSYVVVEAPVDGDAFVHSTVQRALSACAALPYLDIPIVLHVKTHVAPGEIELAHFIDRVKQIITGHALLANRISGLFLDLAELGESQQDGLLLEEPSSHRVLLGGRRRQISPAHVIVHDNFPPITYPVTTPITVPATNPSPAIVTVPSTNPVTFIPTNPTMSPITVTPTNPVTSPITTPMTNPLPTPVSTPLVPVTNPATTPVTYPTNPPTNPVTTYPSTPTWNTPSVTPPVTVPGTFPVTPAVTPALPGQTWCVARTGVIDAALQNALDYACGIGGVDCSALQSTGSCYNPNTLQAHASYAFNNYYQKNPTATSCDFGGTAMLVNANPSSGTCIYPSSSSTTNYTPVSTYNPASTTTGSTPSSGSSVFNTNPGGSSTPLYGSSNPTGALSRGLKLSFSWTYLLLLLTAACISINM